MSAANLPHAKDTTDLAVRAGCDMSGQPEPTPHEVQGYLDMHERIVSYLEGAAQQWVVDNGLPHSAKKPYSGPYLAPDWQDDPRHVRFRYYATYGDEYHGDGSQFSIPVEDLLPEYGRALALIAALRA